MLVVDSFITLTEFVGLGVSMSRSCVVNAIFFTAFEFSKKRINRITVDEKLLQAHEL